MGNVTRNVFDIKTHNLPPNIYNNSKEPYKSRRGMSGAYWKKLKKEFKTDFLDYIKYTPPKKTRDKWKLYNVLNLTDRLKLPHNKHKGVFLSSKCRAKGFCCSWVKLKLI